MGAFTRHDLYTDTLRGLIEEEVERLKEEMAAGLLMNYEDYRSTASKIIGLRRSLEYMDEAEALTNKRIGG